MTSIDQLAASVGLSAEQRKLLEYLLREEQLEPAPADVIERRSGAEAPLSLAQERLWFLYRLDPASAAYHMPAAIRLRGLLAPALLARALATAVARHEMLRTIFSETGGRPVQLVVPGPEVRLPAVDLCGLDPQRGRSELHGLLARGARRPFELAVELPLRAVLWRLGEREHVLQLTVHHIASDGLSMEILAWELATLYGALADGRSAELPELAIHYGDYAAWQRERLTEEALARRLAECREVLAGAPQVLDLPYDRPPRGVEGGAADRRSFVLEPEIAAGLRRLAQRQGVTLFVLLLSAFEVLLTRLSGQEELLVGVPAAGRGRPELEPLIGFFADTLVVRARLREEMTVVELLDRTRQAMLDALLQQDVSFDRLVAELAPQHAGGRRPLVQAVFALQADPLASLALHGLEVEPLEVHGGAAKFDLLLTMTSPGGERSPLPSRIEYDAELFDAATAERMLGQLRVLLEGIVADPEGCPLALPLLSQQELHQVLAAWNDTAREYPREATLAALFAAQAARRPEAVAVVSAAERLTYAELDRRANRLARHLRCRGVVPERAVGLCLERSSEALVAMLAVAKAGGVYVPLDPALPSERLAWLLADAGVDVVLTRSHLLRGWEGAVPEVVCLDRSAEAIAAESELGLADEAVADNLAYVMYTSGSTGTAKGVGVVHRGIVRLVRGNELPRLGEDDVVLHMAPLSFDASTLEIWGSLLNGGCLVVLPPGVPTPLELERELERQGATALWLTAGLFHLMVEEAADSLARVRQLLAGGDVLSAEHVGRLLERRAGGLLINGYGPTENTTFTCCHPVGREWRGASVPIGRPIANSRVYLLDRRLQPVPVGVAGDLYTAGDGLARGYVGRPALTAESFVPDPFGAAGSRMYRTGDVARYLADGEIEFLGRRDQQVKVRGFRVEPGEIESALCGHPSVREAAVLALGQGAGRFLVAWVVARDPEEGIEPGRLRAFLQERLPDFMVPARIFGLAALPLTPNGKVDRRALAAKAALAAPDAAGGERAFAPPRTPTEEALVEIWRSVLGLERVGIHDDFFELGGHSLLAMEVIARVRQTFGVPEISLRRLFQEPTIEQLGLIVTQTQVQSADALEVERLIAELQALSPGEAALLLERED